MGVPGIEAVGMKTSFETQALLCNRSAIRPRQPIMSSRVLMDDTEPRGGEEVTGVSRVVFLGLFGHLSCLGRQRSLNHSPAMQAALPWNRIR